MIALSLLLLGVSEDAGTLLATSRAMIWLALLAQVVVPDVAVPPPAASPPAPVEIRADGSQRWSIKTCDTAPRAGEVLVCGRTAADEFEGPAPGRGANRELSAARALELQSTPCAARIGGCQFGFNILGPPTMLVRVIQKLVDPKSDCCEGGDATNPLSLVRDVVTGAKRGRAPKPDKASRVPILLNGAAPVTRAVATPVTATPVEFQPVSTSVPPIRPQP